MNTVFKSQQKSYSILVALIISVVVGFASVTVAEKSSASAYLGKINAPDVYVRSGPAKVYYHVNKLSQGDEVVVESVMFGWAKIKPTSVCYSWVAKQFVDLGGKSLPTQVSGAANGVQQFVEGRITGDFVNVRAGSDAAVVPPSHADEVQLKVNTNDNVKVIGESGDYYKIVPPKGAYFWVSKKFIDKLGSVPVVKSGAVVQKVNERTVAKTPKAPAAGGAKQASQIKKVAKPVEPVLNQEEIDTKVYDTSILLYKAEMDKAVIDRDFSVIIAALNKALAKSNISSTMKVSLDILQRQASSAALAVEAVKLSREQDQMLKMTLDNINKKVAQVVSQSSPTFKDTEEVVVKGRLATSAVFKTRKVNQRFVVFDKMNNNISFYAISARAGLDLTHWVGKEVRLVGKTGYDSFGKMRLIYVTNVIEVPGE